MRSSQPMTVSLPPEMVKAVDKVRRAESRTRSELVREALRTYFSLRTSPEVSVQPVGPGARRRGWIGITDEHLVATDRPGRDLGLRGGADRAHLRKKLKEGAIRNAERSLKMAKEWSVLEDEAWERSGR